MALVSIQVLEGLERGRIFADLPTPVSIGREDDNLIRLNDERISRFHAKIQEDEGRIILTDLGSTNGTRVNGHPVQLRVLQPGDQICVGRCILVFGSPEEIAQRIAEYEQNSGNPELSDATITAGSMAADADPDPGDLSAHTPTDDGYFELFPAGFPPLPGDLRPVQRAELSDVLSYTHDQIRSLIEASEVPLDEVGATSPAQSVPWNAWQRMLALELKLADALRQIAEPDA